MITKCYAEPRESAMPVQASCRGPTIVAQRDRGDHDASAPRAGRPGIGSIAVMRHKVVNDVILYETQKLFGRQLHELLKLRSSEIVSHGHTF